MKETQPIQPRRIENDSEYFDKSLLNYTYDLSQANFEMDALQDRLMQFYIQKDKKFRMAFYTDYTPTFMQFIKDKVKLNEVVHLSTIGGVRSSKSVSMQSLAIFHQALYYRKFGILYICANQYEYLDKIQKLPEEKLKNRMFILDEDKGSVYGSGSMAKKMKLLDVQNIIAKAGISTISINPVEWSNPHAQYGLRSAGRCFRTGVNRFMLYNLQSSQSTGSPLGMVYIPFYRNLVPESYWKPLEMAYDKKKDEWIVKERMGEGDVLGEMKKKCAKDFLIDSEFLQIKRKSQRLTYIKTKLGSEWTTNECKEILDIISIMGNGIEFD